MAKLRRWLERHAAREARRPSLESALIGGGFFAYARVRLRPLFLGRLSATVAHVLEFTVLISLFAQQGLIASLAFTNSASLLDAFWWGALEVMRSRVRDQSKLIAQNEVRRWLTRSLRMALVVMAVAAAICFRHGRHAGWSALEGYALVCALRLSLDLVLRTFYSGVFAVSRVHRPLAVIVLVEPLGIGAVVLSARHFGEWALPVGLAVSALLSRGLALYYTVRAYRVLRLPLPQLRLRGPRRPQPREPLVPVFLAGLSSLTTRLGAALVLAGLLRVSLTSSQLDPFTFSLHLVSPLIAGAASWGRILYHDWKRISDEVSGMLRRRLSARLLPLALVVGVSFWTAAALVSTLLLGWQPVARGVVTLLPLFVSLAYLSAQQLRQFALGDFSRLALGSLFLCSSVALALALGGPKDAAAWNLILTAVLAAGTLVLMRLGTLQPPVRVAGVHETLLSWVRALAEVREPLVVCSALFNEAGALPRKKVAERLALQLAERGAVVALGPQRRLLWLEIAPAQLTGRDLVTAGGGKLSTLRRVEASDGAAALVAATAAGMLGQRTSGDAALPTLIEEFRSLFPDGMVADLAGPSDLGRLAPSLQRLVWQDAVRSAHSGKTVRGRSQLEVTSYRPGGEIRALFAAPTSSDHATRIAWRRRVEQANWTASQLVFHQMAQLG